MGFRVSGFGFRVSGFGFKVQSLEFWVQGFGCLRPRVAEPNQHHRRDDPQQRQKHLRSEPNRGCGFSQFQAAQAHFRTQWLKSPPETVTRRGVSGPGAARPCICVFAREAIWRAGSLWRGNVDGFVPQMQHVDLRRAGQPE